MWADNENKVCYGESNSCAEVHEKAIHPFTLSHRLEIMRMRMLQFDFLWSARLANDKKVYTPASVERKGADSSL